MTTKENEKLPKDHKLAKETKSMTAGVTPSKLAWGATINLHGHSAHITHTDDKDTMVQYANLARRTFDTHVLNSFLDLGTFPTKTEFTRPTAYGTERAVIEAVTGDCCYQVQLTDDANDTSTPTLTYAQLIEWHMGDMGKGKSARMPAYPSVIATAAEEPDDDSNPFETELKERIEELQAQPEALQFGQALIDDLRAKLETANHEAQLAEINGQIRINKLQREVERLEEKAAIVAPVCKQYCIKTGISETLLNKLASEEGWQIQSSQFMNDDKLNVVLFRDLPAAPAPQLLATDAAIFSGLHIGAVPLGRPPVRTPPMPANQTIVHQPVSRALTNNVSRVTGETKRIPTLAELQQRHADGNAEIKAIFDQTADNLEVLRRKAANQPNPFRVLGAQQS